MGEAKRHIGPRVQLPSRAAIGEALLADEGALVEALIAKARFGAEDRRNIETLALSLVKAAREGRAETGGVDSFLHEYGLSSEEGVLLLCLAEALLRIPDAPTADRLIAGTVGLGDWSRHLGHSDSMFVNASTWGLMLTGRILDWSERRQADLAGMVQRLIARSGEPVIRQALRQAMRILGNQFVLGETIEDALANAEDEAEQGYRFSFDMLGEAARTEDDAERYALRYEEAVESIASWAGHPAVRSDDELIDRPGLSVKLSALHPRYQPSQEARLEAELVPRLVTLAQAMRDAWLPLTIDAEEAERLDLSLALTQPLLADPKLAEWNGLGLAVQAYSKRALPLIAWLASVAEATGRRIPVRLVKGAYWDSEIKWAQEAGLAGYPVFTRKVNTDVAYLAAAKALLARPDCFYPQFATHNAHTIAAIATLAGDRPYEFQRLYGMGEALHREVVRPESLGKPCRIYAPVGGHRDLLAYLVRRLLENGANTSFVNRLADDAAPIEAIVADPVEKAAALPEKANPAIPIPPDLFQPERKNSLGLPLWDDLVREPLLAQMKRALADPATANPIVSGREVEEGGEVGRITSPHDRRVVIGVCRSASPEAIDEALGAAKIASEDWDRRGGEARAALLDRAADLFEAEPRRSHGASGARGGQDACERASRSARSGGSSALFRGASAAELCRAQASQGPDRGGERTLPAWSRPVRLHLALEFPARHFHRADCRRTRRRQCGGGEACGTDPAGRRPRGAPAASRRYPCRCPALAAGTRRERGRRPGQGSSRRRRCLSPAAPTPASPSTARSRRVTGRLPSSSPRPVASTP